MYWILKRLPATRETARRLDLVRLNEMIAALKEAVENPATGIRIVDEQEIKENHKGTKTQRVNSFPLSAFVSLWLNLNM